MGVTSVQEFGQGDGMEPAHGPLHGLPHAPLHGHQGDNRLHDPFGGTSHSTVRDAQQYPGQTSVLAFGSGAAGPSGWVPTPGGREGVPSSSGDRARTSRSSAGNHHGGYPDSPAIQVSAVVGRSAPAPGSFAMAPAAASTPPLSPPPPQHATHVQSPSADDMFGPPSPPELHSQPLPQMYPPPPSVGRFSQDALAHAPTRVHAATAALHHHTLNHRRRCSEGSGSDADEPQSPLRSSAAAQQAGRQLPAPPPSPFIAHNDGTPTAHLPSRCSYPNIAGAVAGGGGWGAAAVRPPAAPNHNGPASSLQAAWTPPAYPLVAEPHPPAAEQQQAHKGGGQPGVGGVSVGLGGSAHGGLAHATLAGRVFGSTPSLPACAQPSPPQATPFRTAGICSIGSVPGSDAAGGGTPAVGRPLMGSGSLSAAGRLTSAVHAPHLGAGAGAGAAPTPARMLRTLASDVVAARGCAGGLLASSRLLVASATSPGATGSATGGGAGGGAHAFGADADARGRAGSGVGGAACAAEPSLPPFLSMPTGAQSLAAAASTAAASPGLTSFESQPLPVSPSSIFHDGGSDLFASVDGRMAAAYASQPTPVPGAAGRRGGDSPGRRGTSIDTMLAGQHSGGAPEHSGAAGRPADRATASDALGGEELGSGSGSGSGSGPCGPGSLMPWLGSPGAHAMVMSPLGGWDAEAHMAGLAGLPTALQPLLSAGTDPAMAMSPVLLSPSGGATDAPAPMSMAMPLQRGGEEGAGSGRGAAGGLLSEDDSMIPRAFSRGDSGNGFGLDDIVVAGQSWGASPPNGDLWMLPQRLALPGGGSSDAAAAPTMHVRAARDALMVDGGLLSPGAFAGTPGGLLGSVPLVGSGGGGGMRLPSLSGDFMDMDVPALLPGDFSTDGSGLLLFGRGGVSAGRRGSGGVFAAIDAFLPQPRASAAEARRRAACAAPPPPLRMPDVPPTPGPHAVALAYDERMMLHSEREDASAGEPPHPECPERISTIWELLVRQGLVARCTRLAARVASEHELSMVHHPNLLADVEAAARAAGSLEDTARPRTGAESPDSCLSPSCVSTHSLGMPPRRIRDCYLNRHTYMAARLAAGCAAHVAAAVVRGEAGRGFAIIRPPGHHAESGTAMGFCYFNNAAVAARAAQAAGAKKVLIVDWDIHHGNGTQHIFDDDASVMYMSTHRYDGGDFFPGTGAAAEVGTGSAQGTSVNVPWDGPWVGDGDFVAAFQRVLLPIATSFAPDVVIISAGFDAVAGDPLGECCVSPRCFGHLTAALLSLGKPTVALLEGGYNLRMTALAAEQCVRTLLGEPVEPLQLEDMAVSAQAREAIHACLRAHACFWPAAAESLRHALLDLPLLPGTDGFASHHRHRRSGSDGGFGGGGDDDMTRGDSCSGSDTESGDASSPSTLRPPWSSSRGETLGGGGGACGSGPAGCPPSAEHAPGYGRTQPPLVGGSPRSSEPGAYGAALRLPQHPHPHPQQQQQPQQQRPQQHASPFVSGLGEGDVLHGWPAMGGGGAAGGPSPGGAAGGGTQGDAYAEPAPRTRSLDTGGRLSDELSALPMSESFEMEMRRAAAEGAGASAHAHLGMARGSRGGNGGELNRTSLPMVDAGGALMEGGAMAGLHGAQLLNGLQPSMSPVGRFHM